jgi:hypothetical protein
MVTPAVMSAIRPWNLMVAVVPMQPTLARPPFHRDG